ncbi:hypothetical protein J4T99_gp087 [Mycobacterium phage Bromden]|uniref:YspA cpYpsA-related SLOG domain-containing protein n=1 Tax=Mycobacterium phage Bromden TaxID=2283252 RepID=A0A345MBM1_9CAUD|nr:hypothetical protein J4T99_gp087 [Mycobacterium phage Bromden]AXH67892.1 hypothetical protein SEA_BROMDEN_87 [Mycobacterium phage Bromden]
MTTRRILVTGSRDWTDRNRVFVTLSIHMVGVDSAVIVHGYCPTGADLFADDFGVRHPRCTVEPHPADWFKACTDKCYHKPRFKDGKPYCPVQGFIRNQKMVDLGADVCLAFPLGKSPGTRDCMARAKKAGIHVINCGDE